MFKLNIYNDYGKLIILIGILILVPLVSLLFYIEDIVYCKAFIIPSLFSFILGIIICAISKKNDFTSINYYNSYSAGITVLFAWTYGFILGAIPFVLSNQLSFTQALFESVSGWTTTGLSVMDVSITPKIFLFHRSFMQFCGGLGFVMMMLIFIQEKQSVNLYSAEGHPDKLKPNMKETARTVFSMYIMYLILGTSLYKILGMSLFDGLMHAMCALSTGGFSTKLNSIGEYNSFNIEVLTILLMIIGTINFHTLLLISKGKFKQILKISELRFMSAIIVVATILIALPIASKTNLNLINSFRISLFNSISALSTTGYSTVSYSNWPEFSIGIMIILMLIGGGIGSTAGGMKLSRVYILFVITLKNIKARSLSKRNVYTMHYYKADGKSEIDKTLILDTLSFVVSYFSIFITGSLLISLFTDSPLRDSMFEFSSALGTVGLSIGLTNPNTTNPILIIEMAGMIFGRLEIFIILTGLYSIFSNSKKYINKKISHKF